MLYFNVTLPEPARKINRFTNDVELFYNSNADVAEYILEENQRLDATVTGLKNAISRNPDWNKKIMALQRAKRIFLIRKEEE